MLFLRVNKTAEFLDRLLESKALLAVSLLLLLGALIRCALASIAPLNPDEAYYYLIGNLNTVADMWRGFHTQVHPPLFFLVVRYWGVLGDSEIVLRLVSVLAGILAALMLYRWIRTLFGLPAALAAAVFGAFSPFLISLSIELRQYSLMLFFALGAVSFFAGRRYWIAALFCTGALSTHYSAVLLLPYFPLLVLVQQLSVRRLDWRGMFRACVPMLIPASVFLFFYFTHIRTFSQREMTRDAKENWLAMGYFNPQKDNVPTFITTRLGTLLDNQYSLPIVSLRSGSRSFAIKMAAIGLGLIGFAVLAARRLRPKAKTQLLYYGAAALAMLLLTSMLAIFGYYPITATRHTAILLVFTLPVAALLLSELCGARAGVTFLCALTVMSGLVLYRGTLTPIFHGDGRRAGVMNIAETLRSNNLDRKLVFSDYGSALVLQYYLEPRRITIDFIDEPAGFFHDYAWAGVHVVCSSIVGWSSPDSFSEQLDLLGRQRDLGPDIYVVNAGWSGPLAGAADASGGAAVKWLVRMPQNPELFDMPVPHRMNAR